MMRSDFWSENESSEASARALSVRYLAQLVISGQPGTPIATTAHFVRLGAHWNDR